METPYAKTPGEAPHRIYNLGNSHPESVLDLIGHIERTTNLKAKLEFKDGPPGDVRETYADISARRATSVLHRKFRWGTEFPVSWVGSGTIISSERK